MTPRDAQGHCRITTRILEDLRDSPEVCTLYQTPPLLTRTRRTAGRGCRQRSAASCDPEHLAPGRRRSAANLRRELFFTHELNAARSLPSTACKALEERGGSPPALARPRVVTDLTACRRHGRKRPRPRHARAPLANPPLPHATCHSPASTRAADARGRQTRTIAAQADVTCSQFPNGCTRHVFVAVVLHGADTHSAVQTRARLTTARRAT